MRNINGLVFILFVSIYYFNQLYRLKRYQVIKRKSTIIFYLWGTETESNVKIVKSGFCDYFLIYLFDLHLCYFSIQLIRTSHLCSLFLIFISNITFFYMCTRVLIKNHVIKIYAINC